MDPTRHPTEVAPAILGWTLVCRGTAGVLTEVEAYHQDEPAAHSHGGRPTPRTRDLFGPGGTAYVYFTHGMHWCANMVTGVKGSGEGILLRAAVPVHGEDRIRERRSVGGRAPRPRELLGGPGRLTQGLGIEGSDSGRRMLRLDLATLDDALAASADGPVLYRDAALAAAVGIALPPDVVVGPRVGITRAVDLPWRFGVRGAPHSRGFR